MKHADSDVVMFLCCICSGFFLRYRTLGYKGNVSAMWWQMWAWAIVQFIAVKNPGIMYSPCSCTWLYWTECGADLIPSTGQFSEHAVGFVTVLSTFDFRQELYVFFSSQHPTSFWTHPVSYPKGTCGNFPGGKSAGTWSWPLISN
jgi:hypothetical protein